MEIILFWNTRYLKLKRIWSYKKYLFLLLYGCTSRCFIALFSVYCSYICNTSEHLVFWMVNSSLASGTTRLSSNLVDLDNTARSHHPETVVVLHGFGCYSFRQFRYGILYGKYLLILLLILAVTTLIFQVPVMLTCVPVWRVWVPVKLHEHETFHLASGWRGLCASQDTFLVVVSC